MSTWHSESIGDIEKKLTTHSAVGLSAQEAATRLVTYGYNKLPEERGESLVSLFFRQFMSPLIAVLAFASLALFFLGELMDAGIIAFVLLFNASLGTIHEGRAQNTLRALKKFIETKATVIRNGQEMIISDTDVVPGDILLLKEGEKIPADARVIESIGLRTDESALTGEFGAIDKERKTLKNKTLPPADRVNMVFKGTAVLSGSASALVVETGAHTEIGAIGISLSTAAATDIPLKKEIASLSRFILYTAAGICGIFFLFGIASGNSLRSMFAMVVSLSVSIIPEGLPIVLTLVLAHGVWRMAQRNALVKKLQAVEALGHIQVIAVDKTGTITKNEMVVRMIRTESALFSLTGDGYSPEGTITATDGSDPAKHKDLLKLNTVATLTSNAHVVYSENLNAWQVSGDPTEAAMSVAAKKIGHPKDVLHRTYRDIGELPFHYQKKYHATLHTGADAQILTVAGAPEVILSLSSSLLSDDAHKPFGKKEKESIEKEITDYSTKGIRVIGFAYTEYPLHHALTLEESMIKNLTFAGFYCLEDSIRPEACTSIQKAQSAGIRVVMITGDHALTAQAIAEKAGIFRTGDTVLTGQGMDAMNDSEFQNALATTTVFARVTPQYKMRIIKGYKARGELIAMTGDGVNDAPALVAADLGIAMGKIGTEVAKEASDIILLDDNFASIIAAVEEGRNIYKKIKRVILYLFATNLGEVLLIAATLLLGMPLPLVPAQIIWLNLVTDSFFDVSLGMEPDQKNILTQQWRTGKSLIDTIMLIRIFFMSLTTMIGALTIFSFYYQTDLPKAWTLAMTTIAVAQWFNAWNCRSGRTSLFAMNPFSNKFLVGALGIVLVLQFTAIYTPFLQVVLRTVPLSLSEIGICILLAAPTILVEELRKLITWVISNQKNKNIAPHVIPAPDRSRG
ncbi:HAD-IC family P-type ATPase [Candidatus Uhrbacteria bacterium]|nr:HAD-IC family P-type ATPase [Candidatus Uhrbacteria bacterium]